MATSDSPLSVPNVTLAVARGNSANAPGQRVISGTGFGSGPTVALFDRFEGASETQIPLSSPEIGAWAQYDNSDGAVTRYYAYNGRTWLKGRDPVTSNSASRASIRYIHPGEFKEFFLSYRSVIPLDKKIPGAANPGELSTATVKSNWKLNWMSTALGTNYAGGGGGADMVIPTFVSNGFPIEGNTVRPDFNTASRYMAPMDLTQDNVFSFYQSGDESAEGASDAIMEHVRTTSSGTTRSVDTGDPFSPLGQTDPVHPSYAVTTLNAWLGNASPNSYVDVLPLMADAYLSVGDNARARVVLGNAPTHSACTNTYMVPPDSWSDTQIVISPKAYENLTYVHIFLANGTLIENAEGV